MDLLALFKQFLEAQKKPASELTIKNYLADLRQFLTWYENSHNQPFHPSALTPDLITHYTKAKQGSELTTRTLERHLSTLRKFAGYLKSQGYISHSPFEIEIKKDSDPFRLKEFRSELYNSKASDVTIKNYINDIKQFAEWSAKVLPHTDDIFTSINSGLLSEYRQRLMTDSGLAPLSVNRKLSSLRRYLSFAESKGLLTLTPTITNLNSKEDKQAEAHVATTLASEEDNKAKSKIEAAKPEAVNSAWTTPTNASTMHNDQQAKVTPEVKIKAYSKFPPLRLLQKLGWLLTLGFDLSVVALAALALEKIQYAAWIASGKQIFQASAKKGFDLPDKLNTLSQLQNKLPETHIINPLASNIKKEFYAPAKLAISHLPFHKKAWFHLRHTRPNWYRKYHSYPVVHYFHFAALIIMMSALGFGLYQSFIENPQKDKILAAPPTAPPRIMSFQGRLTDSSDNPITSAKDLRFAIYNDSTASGAALLWQELQQVTPDQDGIFSVLLGSSTSIPASVFTDNSALYLGVTVQSDSELTPRQQIASVAFATNSETLQGLYPITNAGGATTNVVLALDSSGNLTIGGSANPTFSATGGTFTLSGRTLVLSTTSGSNGNVNIQPDGQGLVNVTKPIINESTTINNRITTAAGAVEVDDLFAVLATSSGQSAFTLDQRGAGPLISASTSGVAKFTVDNSGNGTFAGNVAVNGGSITSTGDLTINATGGQLFLTDTQTIAIGGHAGAAYNAISDPGGTPTNPNVTADNDLYVQGDLDVGGTLYLNGSQLSPGALTNYWQRNSGAIAPDQITNDLLIGGVATNSAVWQVFAVGANAGTASSSGQLTFRGTTDPKINILNGENFGIRTSVGGDGVLTERFTILNNGNIGIGSTVPTAALDVVGSGKFTSTVSGANAVNSNEFVTLSQLTGGTGQFWQRALGSLAPSNITDDVLIGGIATSSAKFGFINVVGNGTPTATISSNFSIQVPTGASPAVLINALKGGTINFQTATTGQGDAGLSSRLFIKNDGNIGIGSTNPSFALDVPNGDFRTGNSITRSLTRTLPTVVDDVVDIGDFTVSNGGTSLEVSVVVPSSSFSVAKQYKLPIQYNQSSGNWVIAQPLSDTGAYGSNNFDLDIRVTNGVASLRLRRTSGSTAGTAYVTITQEGQNTATFTASTATSSVTAPTSYFEGTVVTQINGNVGIGTTAPTQLLGVGSGSPFAVNTTGDAHATTLALGTATIAPTDRVLNSTISQALTNASRFNGVFSTTRTGTLTGSVSDYGLYSSLTNSSSDDIYSHSSYASYNQVNLSDGFTTDSQYGIYGLSLNSSNTISPDTPANTATTSAGVAGVGQNNGTGTITNQYGGLFSSLANSAGTVTTGVGSYNQVYTNNASGTITTAMGTRSRVFMNVANSSIPTAYGLYSDVATASGTTTGGINTAYGARFDITSPINTTAYGVYSNVTGVTTGTNYGVYVNTTGSVTNNYGVRITGTPAATGNYGLYVDAAAKNYFAGNVGIGSTLPASKLDVSGTGQVAQFGSTSLADQYITLRPGGTGGIYMGLDASLNGANGGYLIQGGVNKTINFATNSDTFGGVTPQMVLDLNGNLGIGSTAPATKLDVNGNAQISGYATASASLAVGYSSVLAGTGNGVFSGNVGIGSTAPGYRLDVSGGTGIVAQFSGRVIGGNALNSNEFVTLSQLTGGTGQYWQRANGTLSPTNITDDVLIGGTANATASALIRLAGTANQNSFINTGGNLGIGTNSPVAQLDVREGAVFRNANSSSTPVTPFASSSGEFLVSANSLVTVGESVEGDANPQITLYRTTSGLRSGRAARIYEPDSLGTLQFDIASASTDYGAEIYTNIMTLKSTGNVGIGTASPRQELDVIGDGIFSGNIGIGTTSVTNLLTLENSVGGVEIQGNNENVFNLYTLGSMIFRIDSDNDTTNTYDFYNGANTSVVNINESGDLQIDGNLTVDGGTINSATDLTLSPTGNNVLFSDTTTMQIGGVAAAAYNAISNSGGTPTVGANIADDNDLYVQGNVDIGGTLYVGGAQVGAQYWQRANGTLSPLNITDDLLLGGTATSTARFAFINAGAGTPTASISSNFSIQVPTGASPAVTVNALKGGTLNFQTATSGQGDAGLTSRLFIANNGNVAVGTTNPLSRFVVDVSPTAGDQGNVEIRLGQNEASARDFIIRKNTSSTYGADIIWSANPTIDAGNLRFFSSDQASGERMIITSTGNVGIANTSPEGKLHIDNDTSTLTTENSYAIKIEDGANDTGLVLGASSANDVAIIQAFDPGTSWTTRALALQPNGGNVGIGTTLANARLDVVGDASVSADLVFGVAGTNTIQLLNGDRLDFQTSPGGDAGLATKITINTDGNIGIGNTTPTAPLYINRTQVLSGSSQYGIVNTPTFTGEVTANKSTFGFYNAPTINGTDGQFSHTFYGNYNLTQLSDGNSVDDMRGVYSQLQNNSTHISPFGNTATTSAAISGVALNNASGTVTNQYGGLFSSYNNSTGTVTGAYGSYNQAYNNNATGVVTTAYGTRSLVFTNVADASITTANGIYSTVATASGTTTGGINTGTAGYFEITSPMNTTAYGVRSNVTGVTTGVNYGVYVNTTGSVTNNFGVRVTGTPAAAGNYGLYVDAAAQNYFAGNVGIGDSTPDEKLHVRGGNMHIGGLGGGTDYGIIFSSSDAGSYMWLANIGTLDAVQLGTANSIGSTPRITFQYGGNVGLGSTSPQATLDVVGDIYGSSGISLYNTAVSDDTVEAAKFCTGDGETNCVTDFASIISGSSYWTRSAGNLYPANPNDTISATTSASTALTITQTGAFDVVRFEDQSSDTTPFIINQDGNVGIGTTTPGAALEVSGAGDTIPIIVKTQGGAGGQPGFELVDPTATSYGARVYFDDTLSGLQLVTLAAGVEQQGIFIKRDDGNVGIGSTAPTQKLDVTGGFKLGNNTGTGQIDTSDWDISTTGVMTGISGITTDGGYTQSGSSTNTFSGATTISATGTALTLSGAATTAINISNTGVTTDINLQNSETIDNNIDGTVRVTGQGHFTGDISVASSSAIPTSYNSTNLLPNPSFEVATLSTTPDNWGTSVSGGTATRTFTESNHGTYSMDLDVTVAGTGQSSIRNNGSRVAIEPGRVYTISTYAKVDTACGDGFYLRASWRDQWGNGVSSSDAYSNSGAVTTSWALYSGTVTAPATAYSMYLEIYNFQPTNACHLYVDQVSVRPALDGDLLANGDVLIGASAETIAAAGFTLDNTSLFVAGNVGVEGTLYSDAGLNVNNGVFAVNSSGAITAVTGITTSGGYTQSGASANTFTGTSTFSGDIDSNGNLSVADTNIAFDGASTTFTTTGAFTLTPGGAVLLGDGGDTMQINTSDWDVSTTGDLSGIGTIALNGTITQTGVTGFSSGTGTSTFNGLVNTAQDVDIIPSTTTGTSDLGSSGVPWDNVYADNVYVGGVALANYWTRSAGNLYPANLNDTISATTSAATVLTLTQTGAFDALLVQDASGDTSPFVINQSGNVGIQTTSPTAGAGLDVAAGDIFVASTEGLDTRAASGTLHIGETNATTVTIGGTDSTARTVNLAGGTGANTINIGNAQTGGSINLGAAMTTGTITIGGTGAQTGTIGIGTGTGAQTLNFGTGGTGIKTINIGTGAVANSITIGTTTGAASLLLRSGTGDITLSGTDQVILNTSKASGGTTTEAFSIKGTADLGAADEVFQVGDSAADFLTILGNGNVGIGTVNPGQELDVNGDLLLGANSTIDTRAAGTLTIGGTTQTGLTLGRAGATTTITGSAPVTITPGFDANAASTVTALTIDGAPTTALTISGAATNGIDIGNTSITTDIILQNDETIDNNTDGTITLTATNVTASGDLTVSGGDITGANGAAIDIGEATSGDIEITGDLLPTTDATYDIGSTTKSWNNIYLTGNLCFDDTDCMSGPGGYWQRVAGNLSPVTLNDTLSATSAAYTVATFTTNNPAGTLTNNTLIQQTGAGTVTNLLNLTQSAGTVTNGLTFTGTFTNLISATNFSVTNAGNLDAGGTLTAGTANAFTVSATGVIATITDETINGIDISSGAVSDVTSLDINGAASAALTISGAATTGINLSNTGITTDINLQNSETIDNNTDGQITLTATTVQTSGNLDVNGASNDIAGTLNLSGSALTSTGDLTINMTAGTADQLFLADTDTIGIGGVTTDTAYNFIASTNVTGAGGTMNADNDLYIEGDLEVEGTLTVGNQTIANYWTRSAGNLYPTNLNDTISATTSASTVLTLTQTGAFDALLVQDASGDTSPFVVNQSGNVGIQTTSPTAGAGLDVAAGDILLATTEGLDNRAASSTLNIGETNATTITIGGTNATARTINIGTGTAANNITIGTTNGAASLLLRSGTGDITLSSTDQVIFNTSKTAGATTTEAFSLKTTTDLGVADELFQIGDSAADFMTVLGGGNIGIGTTSPLGRLDIAGSGGVYGTNLKNVLSLINNDASATNNGTLMSFWTNRSGNILTNIASISAVMTSTSGSAWTGDLAFSTAGPASVPTERMRITSNGNVGIGLTNPGAKLEIAGASSISNTSGNLTISSAADIVLQPTTKVNISASGGVYGTNLKDILRLTNSDSSATNNGVAMSFWANRSGNIATNIASVSAILTNVSGSAWTGELAFATAGSAGVPTERMRITSAGNVGIGTTNPSSARLQVGAAGGSDAIAANNFFDIDNSSYFLDPAAATNSMAVAGNVGIGTSSPLALLHSYGTTAGADFLRINDGANNQAFRFMDGGRFQAEATPFDSVFSCVGASCTSADSGTFTDNTTESKSSLGTAYSTIGTGTTATFYVGMDHQFEQAFFDIATAGGGVTLVAEYWNGSAWTSVTPTDSTTNLTTDNTVTWTTPGSWATKTVNATSRYWIRFRSSTNVTTAPTAYITQPTGGYRFEMTAAKGDSSGLNFSATGQLIITTNSDPNNNGFNTSGLTLGNCSSGASCGTGYKWIQSYNSDPLVLNPLGNNVGIGITTPNSILHADGGASSGNFWLTNTTTGSTTTDGLVLGHSGSTAYLWNYEANALRFATNNTEQMRIASDGNVGIGTTNPGDRLHLYDAAAGVRLEDSDFAGAYGRMSMIGSAGSTLWDFNMGLQSGSGDATIRVFRGTNTTGSTGINVYKGNNSTTSNAFIAGNGDTYFANDNGNVGISTSTPLAMLHLVGTNTTAKIRVQSTNVGLSGISQGMTGIELTSAGMNTTSKYTPAIKFGSTDTEFTTFNPKFLAGIAGRATESYGADTNGGMALDFFTASQSAGASGIPWVRMSVDNDGNVGIGITTPARQLEIEGDSAAILLDDTGTGGGNFTIDGYLTGLSPITGTSEGTVMTGPDNAHVIVDIPANDSNDGFMVRSDSDFNGSIDTIVFHARAGGSVAISATSDDNERLCHSGADGTTLNQVTIEDCTVVGEDFAEWAIVENPEAEPGDLVYVKGNLPSDLTKTLKALTNTPYQSNVSGIISTNPYIDVLGDEQYKGKTGAHPIGLTGRIPVKVTTNNGTIRVGDPLVASSIPGVAMKGTGAGMIIGFAEEDFDGSKRISEQVLDQERIFNSDLDDRKAYNSNPSKWPSSVGKIMTSVRPMYYDPGVFIAKSGNLNITGSDQGSFEAWAGQYKFENKGGFADAVIARLTAGFIKTKQLVVEGPATFLGTIQASTINASTLAVNNINIAGQTLRDYIISVVQQAGLSGNGTITSPISADQISTNIISPLGGKEVTVTGDVVIKKTASAAGNLTVEGNASVSGSLVASQLTTTDATVSGTLRAGRIIADDIEGLNARIASIAANTINSQTLIASSSVIASGATQSGSSSAGIASSSATPRNDAYSLIADSLYTEVADISSLSASVAYIPNLDTETTTIGQGLMVFGTTSLSDTAIAGQLSVGGSLIIADNSINVLGGSFEIQPLRQGNVSFEGGLVAIDTDGNLTVGGNATFAKDVTVNGNLSAKLISPVPSEDLIIQLPGDPTNTSTLAVDRPGVVVKNASGSSVLKITDVGDVIASGAAVASQFQVVRGAQADTSLTQTVATASAGTAIIKLGQYERTIVSPYVTEKSLVYITPVTDTSGVTPFVARQVAEDKDTNIKGSFTIRIPVLQNKDVKVNWWIIN